MNTTEFISSLRPHHAKALVFQYGDARVPAGYHVTEVKAVQYQTMDCGGQGNAWAETIVQLWNPDAGDEAVFMPVEKFLKIYDRAAAGVPVVSNAEIRLEYGNDTLPATNFLVERLEDRAVTLVVHLQAPRVTCKAQDRRAQTPGFTMLEPTAGAACCTPGEVCC